MAKPFGHTKDSGDQQENGNNKAEETERITNLLPKRTECPLGNSKTPTSNQSDSVVTNVYYVVNSRHLNCGPTFINVIKNGSTLDNISNSGKGECEVGRKIKIRKGVLTSERNISLEDIQKVAKDVEKDWKKLLKKLPGVTLNNLSFHQAFINAMDRKDSTSMAEIALCTWKTVLPEFSTIGNLSKTLFSIGHPDIVTRLRP